VVELGPDTLLEFRGQLGEEIPDSFGANLLLSVPRDMAVRAMAHCMSSFVAEKAKRFSAMCEAGRTARVK